MPDAKKVKKYREAAAKLSKPRPVELPSGKWRCQMMVKGQRIDVIEDDPTIAHAKALAIKAGILESEAPAAALTVGQAIDRYIESKDAVLSPSTIRGYKQMRKHSFSDIQNESIKTLTQDKIQRWVNRLAKESSPKYVRNSHGLLSATLSVYKPNMAIRTTLPQKEKTEIAIPTMEEIQAIAQDAKGKQFELPFLLAIWLGLRTSEIRGLTWDCYDGEVLHIRQAIVEGEGGPVLKGTKSYSGNRKIQVPNYIKKLIDQQPKTDEFIIHYTRNALYNHLRRSCDRLGIQHYRFHDLRHVQASVMLLLNVPDKYAMERMGHSSNNMLKNVYQHTMAEKAKAVASSVDSFFEETFHV